MADKAADRATLVWQAQGDGVSCIESWKVEPKGAGDTQVSCGPKEKVQRMVLHGLQADTDYAYRIYSGQGDDPDVAAHVRAAARDKSTAYGFRTGSGTGDTCHFAVMGDSHGNREVLRGLLGQSMRARPNLDFLLHVGDAVNDGGVPGTWYGDFVDNTHDYLAALPVHVALGNHEKGAPPPFVISEPPGTHFPSVQSFVRGNAFFLLANTNQDFSPGSPQHRDIELRLSSPEAQTATWRFAAFHHPPFAAGWDSCEGYDGEPKVRDILVPLLRRYGVDVVFNGHVHGYERGEWQGVTYVTTGGGGGALDHACNQWPHIAVTKYVHHVLGVDVAGQHLSVTAQALDGSVIDHFALDKTDRQVRTTSR